MEPREIRVYKILLADPEKNQDFAEGNIFNGEKVYGSVDDTIETLSDIFQANPIPSAVSTDILPVWNYRGSTIFFQATGCKDKPNNPSYLGSITTVGEKQNLDSLEAELNKHFVGISQVKFEGKYS